MPGAYRIRLIVLDDGERLPMLVYAATGIPVFDACVYVVTTVRPRSGSEATIEQALRGVQLLEEFAGDFDINLNERIATGRFLDLHELDNLARAAYSLSPKRDDTHRANGRAKAVVAPSTASIRLYYAGQYLQWLAQRATGGAALSLDRRSAYTARLDQFMGHLKARTPSGHTGERLSLTAQELNRLKDVIDPQSTENPWSSMFARDRNRLLVLWGLGTGLRRGELLGLEAKRINFRTNTVTIVRRPDDIKDPRKRQPNTKTRGRMLDISEELASLTDAHIRKYRSRIPGAHRHGFLFVAENGNPLSLSALSKIFRVLRNRCPDTGATLTMHVLRHVWNEDFSRMADEIGLGPEEERRARIHAMGWSDLSKSADRYLKRLTQQRAAEASVKIQQSVIGKSKGIKNDKQ